jgi:hypothetical protein
MKNIYTDRKVVPISGMYRGLCLTCKKADTCNFPRDIDHPIMNCDEFDGYVLPKKSKETPYMLKSRSASNHKNKGITKYTGLCINCDNRKTCTYPKSGKTIWCCEEYQ